MVLQNKIPVLPSPAIASYNYTDIAEGTGVVTLYAFRTGDSTGFSYKLSTQTQYCEDTNLGNGAEVDLDVNTDIDFDLSTFNMPQNIKGTMRCQLPTYYSGGASPTYKVEVKLRKWDGTTETEIASVTSDTFTAGQQENLIVMDIDVPLTHFKKGETLRVSILTTTTGGLNVWLAISPNNLNTTNFTVGTNTPTTICKFDIPFVLKI